MTYLHINRPTGHYIGQTRRYGHKHWDTVTGRCKSPEGAMSRAAARMGAAHRARVLFIDHSGYYEAHICMEAKR